MDRNAVKTFATWARRHLREQATARLDQFGITPTAIAVATPVTGGLTVAGQVLDAADAQDYQQLLTHLEDLQRQEKTLKAAVERLIDEIAYTWFNRLAALRFMEVNGYLGQRVISSSDPNLVDPDLLRDAGSIAELESLPGLTLDALTTWRDQASRAPNPDEALYRRLLGVQCQALSESLPFLFDPQQDYLTLFMPGSLLNQDSIIRRLVNDIPETDWRDSSDSENGVEIIGWLYQFYISERKDEVIGAKSKIAARDIPAATQLFTPHWIVRYMVENSLGRLWLESHPESGLRAVMKYYLESPPEEAPHPLTPASHALRSTPTGGEGGQEAASAPLSRSGRGAGGEGLPLQPQELTVLDPACGSGHILVYAFDLLFEIYKEQGYRERDIPALILAHNLHGLDIDERAVQLASFAVLMKARAKNPRFFRDPSQIPHLKILTVRSTRPLLNSRQLAVSSEQLTVHSSQQELPLTTDNWQLSTDPPTDNCQLTTENSSGIFSLAELNREDWLPLLEAFKDADNLGSLITPPVFDGSKLLGQVEALERNNPLFGADAGVLRGVVEQAELLRRRYWVVVANPPYMGSGGFNPTVKDFVEKHYKEDKGDLYAAFISRNLELARPFGAIGMITIPNWMFLSSFEDLRRKITNNYFIESLIHNGRGVFGSDFGSCSFILKKQSCKDTYGLFKRLFERQGSVASNEELEHRFCNSASYYAKSADFDRIPGSAIAYWASQTVINAFPKFPTLETQTISDGQNKTGKNDRFVRYFWEVSNLKVSTSSRYRFYAKGGEFRRWYGNTENVVNWSEEARTHYRKDKVCRIIPKYLWGKIGITWTFVTSSFPSFRLLLEDSTFDVGGSSLFFKDNSLISTTLGFLNSPVATTLLGTLNPTLNLQVENIRSLPLCIRGKQKVTQLVDSILAISKQDWNNFETSWDFQSPPLFKLVADSSQSPVECRSLTEVFQIWEAQSEANFQELKRLEEENNRYWIDAYGLQDELTPEVPDEQITIRRADLERDIKSLISYAVGCMMGRYSLERPGLILASQGQSVEDYWCLVNSEQLTANSGQPVNSSQLTVNSSQQETPLTTDNWQLATSPSTDNWQLTTPPPTDNWKLTTDNSPPSANLRFPPDQDAILPITDQAYFDDDIVSRFVEFVKVAFGPDTLTENLDFIANALKLKSGETAQDRIRRYFVTEFISDHIRTYKKRPIYWLFTSGKKRAFGALVYLHRYTPDTVGRIRTDYILELQVKLDKEIERLQAQAETATTTAAKRAATKRLKELQDQQLELRDYQAKVQTFGDKRIALDLDDGVAYNYTRFKGIVYEGTDLKMKDLEAKAQWKLDLIKEQLSEP